MPAQPKKRHPRRKATDEVVERAGMELVATGGNVAEAARRAGVKRTTLTEWIKGGVFETDQWEHERDQRKLTAIERAYDALNAHIDVLKVPHNQTITSRDGQVTDLGPVQSPNAVRALVELLVRFGGIPVAAGGQGSGSDPSAKPGETVYRIVIERREGAPTQPVPAAVGVRQLP